MIRRGACGRRRSQLGQSMTEYVMLIVFVAGLGRLLSGNIGRLLGGMEKSFKSDYARTYKYGRPDACGYEDEIEGCSGSPENHPRYSIGGRNHLFARGVR